MSKNAGLIFTLSAVVLTAILHTIATLNHYYFFYWWWHFLVHGMGGFSVGAAAISFWNFGARSPRYLFFYGISCALGVGIFWEIYEKVFDLVFTIPVSYAIDIFIDLTADVVGVAVSVPILIRFGSWLKKT